MPRRKFETTFGEAMAQLGVKKLGASSGPARVRTAAQRRAEAEKTRAPISEERLQLLEAVERLQLQHTALREELQTTHRQLQQEYDDNSVLRQRLRDIEAARRADLATMAALREELAKARQQHQQVVAQRDRLQRRLDVREARQALDDSADADLETVGSADHGLQPDEGSDIRQAAFELAEVCTDLGIERLVIVGGSPNYRQRLTELFGDALQLRLIGGRERRTLKQAKADVVWADIVIICGGSILDHRLSELYRGEGVLTLSHRGLAGLLRRSTEMLSD